MYPELQDIPGFKNWHKVTPIDYGWSEDKKFYVETRDGTSLVVRLARNVEMYRRKRMEFEVIGKFNMLPVTMSQALEFGVCDDGRHVYMLLSFVPGRSLEEALPEMQPAAQYGLGLQAGLILRQFHSLPADNPIHWPRKNIREKKAFQLEKYCRSDVREPGDQPLVDLEQANFDKIGIMPPVYQHGDFHAGNLLLTPDSTVGVIDFNRWDVYDPFEEFYKTQLFDREVSEAFAMGKIDGYFNGSPPMDFWEAHRVYVIHAILFSILWAKRFGPQDVANMRQRYHRALADYDNFAELIPEWYNDHNRWVNHD